MNTAFRFFASPRGRITRTRFVGGLFLVGAAFFVFFVFLETMIGRGSTLVLYPPFLWSAGVLATKRLHDRGSSAWSLLLLAVPVLGPLWLGVSLCLLRGSAGENQYGQNPHDDKPDYFAVDINRPGPPTE